MVDYEGFVEKTKERATNAWDKTKSGAKKAWNFTVDHAGEIMTGTMAIGTVVITVVRAANGVCDLLDRAGSDKTYYDRSIGRDIRLKRRLKDWEIDEARDRHNRTGESYYQIYKDKGLIKH